MPEQNKGPVTPLIFNEEPVKRDEKAYLQFSTYADTLARIIAGKMTRTPLTLGIFGECGQQRLDRLARADELLDLVRFYLRLAARWGWLTPGQYQHAAAMVAEIGRLLGGWSRATRILNTDTRIVAWGDMVLVADG